LLLSAIFLHRLQPVKQSGVIAAFIQIGNQEKDCFVRLLNQLLAIFYRFMDIGSPAQLETVKQLDRIAAQLAEIHNRRIECHDVRADFVLTEDALYACKGGG